MIVITVYSLFTQVRVELACPTALDDPSTLTGKPHVLATRTTHLEIDRAAEQVGQIISDLLDAAADYGWPVEDLITS